MRTYRTWMFFAPSKFRQRAKVWKIGVSKTSGQIQIKIHLQNPSQELPAPSKAPKQDLKDIVLITHSKSRQRVKFQKIGVSTTCNHIQIKNKIPKHSQKPPLQTKSPNKELKDIDILCTLKIKMTIQNFDHGSIKDQLPYQN